MRRFESGFVKTASEVPATWTTLMPSIVWLPYPDTFVNTRFAVPDVFPFTTILSCGDVSPWSTVLMFTVPPSAE